MTRKEIVNSQDYKATEAALKWWYSLPEEQRKATDIDAEPDIVDAYAEGVIYGWNNPQWIPVKERLPEEVSEIHHCSTDVLIGYFANGDNYYTTARYNCKEKVWYDADDWGEIDFPTHWMPLPQPPRKED